MTKYHFLTASTSYYSGNNFSDLLEEEKKYGGFIYWHIGTNKRMHRIGVGDKCLIYYSNLPDYSSRILFVGEVTESDYNHPIDKSSFKDEEKNIKYVKMRIKPVDLEDDKMFSLEKLRNYYKLLPTKGQFSYLHVDENKHKKLIDDIENEIKYTKKSLKYVNDYFNNNYCICEFGCKPFIEENGFYYVERHHLVEKNLINKNKHIKEIDRLINDPRNIYKLCPDCHMKIHHIKIDERKTMIDALYKKNKSFYDNNFTELKGNKNALEWLYEIYKCNK